MTDILFAFLLFCVGGITSILIDVLWWNINYKKAEKGLEVLEHYHMGLILLIIAIIANLFYESIALFLTGMGFLFIIAEWHQTIHTVGKKVVSGKPFAWGSVHFIGSSIIGIILSGILLSITVIL